MHFNCFRNKNNIYVARPWDTLYKRAGGGRGRVTSGGCFVYACAHLLPGRRHRQPANRRKQTLAYFIYSLYSINELAGCRQFQRSLDYVDVYFHLQISLTFNLRNV